jgi:hypothetical protein
VYLAGVFIGRVAARSSWAARFRGED